MATLIKRPGRTNWLIQYFDGNGKRREISSRTTDKRTAERLAAKLEQEAQDIRGGLVDAGKLRIAKAATSSIEAHIRAYITYCEQAGQAAKNILVKRTHLDRLVSESGIQRLEQLTPEVLQQNMYEMQVDRKGAKHAASPRTRNFRRQTAVAFMSWCVKTERAATNRLKSVAKVDERSGRSRVRRALTEQEFEQLIAVAREQDAVCNANPAYLRRHPPSRRAAWYLAAGLAGLRKGDLKRLAWGDVDLLAMTLTVRQGKAKRVDVLPLHPLLAEELSRLERSSPDQPVFPTVVTDVTRRKDFERAGIKADDQGRVADLHALRTTLGTMLARQGVAPQVAQRLMRHSDYRTTLSHYTNLGLKDTAAAVNGLSIGTQRPGGNGVSEHQHHQQKRQQSARQSVQNGAKTPAGRDCPERASNRLKGTNTSRANELCESVRSDADRCYHPVNAAGVTQLVECQPSKLNVAGSIPVARFPAPRRLASDMAASEREPRPTSAASEPATRCTGLQSVATIRVPQSRHLSRRHIRLL